MRKLISAVLLGVFALSFVAGIAISDAHADDPVPLCVPVKCKFDFRTGEYYWWCCETVEQKGKNGKVTYSDCRFAYEMGPCN